MAGVHAGRHALDAWGCAGVHVLLGDAVDLSGRDSLGLALTGFAHGVRAVCGDDVAVSRIETSSDIHQRTADWLAANPDVEHVVATSVTDNLTVDMSLAMEEAGRSGIVAAPNAGPASAARLAEGPPAETRYLGSAATLPETYGTTAVAALIDILEERPVPQEIHTDHTWITHNTIDQHTNPRNPPTPQPDTQPDTPAASTPQADTAPNPTSPPDSTFTAITAGGFHSCGLRTDSTITCWGDNSHDQGDAPAGDFTIVSAGWGAFVRPAHRQQHHLLGRQLARSGERSGRRLHRHHRRSGAFVRPAHRQHHHLLGRQRARSGERSGRRLHRRQRRLGAFVRPAHRQHHHLLGLQRGRSGEHSGR